MVLIDLPTDIFLFYSVVITYFVFLFYTFNIEDIKKKVNGIEILFISGAVGVVTYLLLKYTISIAILPAISYFQSLLSAPTIFPLHIWYYPPSIIGYSFDIIKELLIIAIFWFFVGVLFFSFCKAIQFCLDPENKIFPNLGRFKVIQEYHIKRIFIVSIPLFLIYLAVIVIIFGYDYKFLQDIAGFISGFKINYIGIYDLFYAIYGIVGIILSTGILYLIIKLLLGEIFVFIRLFSFVPNCLKKLIILVKNVPKNLFDYKYRVTRSELKRYYLEKWIFKHWKLTIFILILLIIIFIMLIFIQPIYFGQKCYEHPEVNKVICLPSGPFISTKLF